MAAAAPTNFAPCAERQLGWKPQTHWRELAQLMVDADIALLDDELSGRSVRIDR